MPERDGAGDTEPGVPGDLWASLWGGGYRWARTHLLFGELRAQCRGVQLHAADLLQPLSQSIGAGELGAQDLLQLQPRGEPSGSAAAPGPPLRDADPSASAAGYRGTSPPAASFRSAAVKGAEGDGPHQSPPSRTFSLSLVLTGGSWPPRGPSPQPSSFSMRLSQSARSSWAVPRREEASRVCPSRCTVSALLWPTIRYRILRDSIFSCAS